MEHGEWELRCVRDTRDRELTDLHAGVVERGLGPLPAVAEDFGGDDAHARALRWLRAQRGGFEAPDGVYVFELRSSGSDPARFTVEWRGSQARSYPGEPIPPPSPRALPPAAAELRDRLAHVLAGLEVDEALTEMFGPGGPAETCSGFSSSEPCGGCESCVAGQAAAALHEGSIDRHRAAADRLLPALVGEGMVPPPEEFGPPDAPANLESEARRAEFAAPTGATPEELRGALSGAPDAAARAVLRGRLSAVLTLTARAAGGARPDPLAPIGLDPAAERC